MRIRHDYLDPQTPEDQVLVVVFLRGGADGLTLVPPVNDDGYHRARPTIGVSPRDAMALDDVFSLHADLKPLMPWYERGELAIVHGVGSEDATRSHFEAQDFMEHAGNTGGGWINLGQTVSGSLSPGDPQLNSGEYYDTYQVNVSGGQTVRFRCNSQQFDTYLIIIDPQQQQRENDDMTGTNAGLDLYMPASGTAQIHVTSYQAGETGGYTLQVY